MKSTLKALLASLLLATSAAASAASKGEILVLLSSETALPLQGGKSLTTGFYQNELGVPAAALLEAGYTLTPVTPRGNRPVADKSSVDPQYFGGNPQAMARIGAVVDSLFGAGKVLSLKEVLQSGPERYAGLFIPGGHAPLIDLATDPEVGTLLRHFHDNHKPTAAICHGPIALLAAQGDPAGFEQSVIAGKADGAREWIYDGYRMTIFSDEEEAVFEASLKGDRLRYYPAQAMARAGGKMQFVAPWQPGVVVDRELITGQNPFSDHALASAFIAALDKRAEAN
ncbi:type 1 glutamine amidotransferase domain-containing protein [Aeromonas media]|uniref:type 1 glutamine amidotransferase domain-containing protein n=1 Tax=Aeromonas media TaxID=651 RepID=UPI0029DAEE86|nr:type 1 glutamine amidotransferase domain-containing protein [Aeromonas media]MDX7900310.1 type 1 glutamine amidotransferase domain-containing protein [Aeromonas media]